jgi:MerR family transcriptional regulator, copper efflux regulator
MLEVKMSDRLLTIGELARRGGVVTSAREAINHALRCPHKDIRQCPNFASVIAARLTGQPLHQAHPH